MDVAQPEPGTVIVTARCLNCKTLLVKDPRDLHWLHLATRDVPCPAQPADGQG